MTVAETLGRVAVTGGGGFLGLAIVRHLRELGVDVTALGRREYPAAVELGAQSLVCDVTDTAATRAALAGHDTVIHTAALAGVWGPAREYERANVLGTRHVVEACRAGGVRRLVHTSSPSVVFDGRSHRNAGNDLRHPERFLAHYPRTKAEAERIALGANAADPATVALPPT
ncbi:MAG: NAD-dependent epimerase/dehydratase family protein [Planctomycetota bacterium]